MPAGAGSTLVETGRFVAELRRRNVFRMAGLYLVGAWLVTQVAGTLLPMFEAPAWIARTVVILLAIAFVPALVLAWVFELTPDGLKRDADVPPHQPFAPQTARRLDRMLLIVATLAIGYFAVDKFVFAPRREQAVLAQVQAQAREQARAHPDASAQSKQAPTQQAQAGTHSIAVLPFVNMSSDKEQDYFSDGLSEQLLNQLAQVSQLRVIARTSSFSFKGKEVDVATIAKALGVANILEGSVRKSGSTLRITAQLVRASDSSHLWSHTYDRQLNDVFKVQDEISAAVVDALKVKLLPEQSSDNPSATSPQAYSQYLIGRQFLRRGNPDNWRRAANAFHAAIALDPAYAAAYAALSEAEYFLGDTSGEDATKQKSIDDAATAIRLAPSLADGYSARGISRLSFRRDWDGAREDLTKAISLSPGDSESIVRYARLLIALGDFPKARVALEKATMLDPLADLGWMLLGGVQNGEGDNAAARQSILRGLQINPESEFGNFALGATDLLDGKPADALAAFQRIPGSLYGLAGLAMAYHSLGRQRESDQALSRLIAEGSRGAAYQIAQVYAWRGDTDKAFEWLDRAYAQNDSALGYMKRDLVMAKVDRDPRYAAMVKKLGLPE